MKKGLMIIGLVIAMFGLCSCNKQIVDLDFKYDKAICNYDGEKFELYITKWNDYDGEQIQIKSGEKTFLISTNKCFLVKE